MFIFLSCYHILLVATKHTRNITRLDLIQQDLYILQVWLMCKLCVCISQRRATGNLSVCMQVIGICCKFVVMSQHIHNRLSLCEFIVMCKNGDFQYNVLCMFFLGFYSGFAELLWLNKIDLLFSIVCLFHWIDDRKRAPEIIK